MLHKEVKTIKPVLPVPRTWVSPSCLALDFVTGISKSRHLKCHDTHQETETKNTKLTGFNNGMEKNDSRITKQTETTIQWSSPDLQETLA